MIDLPEIVWPRLQGEASSQELRRQLEHDLTAIQATRWENELDLAVAEARKLEEDETERRRGADARATTYLLVVAALVPLLTYLESAVWDRKTGSAPRALSLAVLLAGVLYLLSSGFWAFRTLQVRVSFRFDAADLARLWAIKDPRPQLIRKLLLISRSNRDGVNQKISCLKMTHEFLIRAFAMFVILIIVEGVWELTHLGPHRAVRSSLFQRV